MSIARRRLPDSNLPGAPARRSAFEIAPIRLPASERVTTKTGSAGSLITPLLHSPFRRLTSFNIGCWALDVRRSSANLQFKKLAGCDRIWSIRISAQYRVVGERHRDTISGAWIGPHNGFDKPSDKYALPGFHTIAA